MYKYFMILFLVLISLTLFFYITISREFNSADKAGITKNFIYKDNNLVLEKTEALWGLKFLYLSSLGKKIRSFVRALFFSFIYPLFQYSRWSKSQIDPFIKKYNINMDDFEVPEGGFKSFNDFFIRKLKRGARKIDNNIRSIISPADSKLIVVPEITRDTRFFVKSCKFSLEAFLKDRDLANKYDGGTLLLFRLAIYDYHRYHFPFDCVPSKPCKINGMLESVNPIVYKSGLNPLLENKRELVILDNNLDLGTESLMVIVGAQSVGRITHSYKPGINVLKGDEMGYFSFGGSSLVLLFKKGKIKVNKVFTERSEKSIETVVKMGESVGEIVN